MQRRISLRRAIVGVVLVLVLGGLVAALALVWWRIGSPTRGQLRSWFADRSTRAALITDLQQPCPGAPFLFPAKGFAGFLYGDGTAPYMPWNPHTGIDIFGEGEPGTIPVFAAYDGYLTRLPNWISAVILRIPQDPLEPSRQIWVYYAHMASEEGDSYIVADFPPGTSEKPVKRGDLLGYIGLYNGTASYGIGMHVHVSIVLSEPDGSFKNEGRFENTLDPSPYFGLTLDARQHLTIPVRCGA